MPRGAVVLRAVSRWTLAAVFVSLAGCHWVLGDFEVVEDEDLPIEQQVCQVASTYQCQNNKLYLCVTAGSKWSWLLDCTSGSVCSASMGECVAASSTMATSGTSTTGANATDENAPVTDVGIGGTFAQ